MKFKVCDRCGYQPYLAKNGDLKTCSCGIIKASHYNSIPILIEFIKELKTYPDEHIRKMARKALREWDKARTVKY